MVEDLNTNVIPMDFHPCDTPRGMLYYNMDILTNEQQQRLNALKVETAREDEKYLARHPEIRACIAIITRLVFRLRPRTNIHEAIAEYFSKSRVDIENEIQDYINSRESHVYEATSGLDVYTELSESDRVTSVGEKEEALVSPPSSESTEELNVSAAYSWTSAGIPEIGDTKLDDFRLTSSLRNIGVEYKKIKQVSSDTIVKSISIITQTAEDELAPTKRLAMADETTTFEITPKESDDLYSFPVVPEYVKDQKGKHPIKEKGSEITGHIPTIEDYAGYAIRRQTFEAHEKCLPDPDQPSEDQYKSSEAVNELMTVDIVYEEGQPTNDVPRADWDHQLKEPHKTQRESSVDEDPIIVASMDDKNKNKKSVKTKGILRSGSKAFTPHCSDLTPSKYQSTENVQQEEIVEFSKSLQGEEAEGTEIENAEESLISSVEYDQDETQPINFEMKEDASYDDSKISEGDQKDEVNDVDKENEKEISIEEYSNIEEKIPEEVEDGQRRSAENLNIEEREI